MKKRQLTVILASLIIAALTASMTGCAARIYEEAPSSQASVVLSAPTVEESKEEPSEESSEEESSEEESSEEESSEEESSEEESSEEESSEEESSEEESSEEESSEEESSEEESSEEESSEEESSEEESSEEESGQKVTFVKPDDWSDNIYIVVYPRGGQAEMPGDPMTNNGDGTFSYVLKEDIEDPIAIFHDADDTRTRNRNMYPRSGSIDFIDGETYEVAVG